MTKYDESHPTNVAAITPDTLTMGEVPTRIVDSFERSDEARRLGVKYRHKLMFKEGITTQRRDLIW